VACRCTVGLPEPDIRLSETPLFPSRRPVRPWSWSRPWASWASRAGRRSECGAWRELSARSA